MLSLTVCFGICFFFKQKTAYEMRISDWSSDVCSSDLSKRAQGSTRQFRPPRQRLHGIKGSVSTRHRQRFCPIFAEAIHLTKTDPQRQRSIPLSLQAVVPKACIDIDGDRKSTRLNSSH